MNATGFVHLRIVCVPEDTYIARDLMQCIQLSINHSFHNIEAQYPTWEVCAHRTRLEDTGTIPLFVGVFSRDMDQYRREAYQAMCLDGRPVIKIGLTTVGPCPNDVRNCDDFDGKGILRAKI